jgi:MoaE-MoaD fusion protein
VKIELLYFAVLRERAGRERESLELSAASTVADLMTHLATRSPALAGLSGRVQVAVNRQMVSPSHALSDGDEVALIPPVSGGSAAPRRILISAQALSVAEASRAVEGPAQGAVATFTGLVRERGTLPDVTRLEYEAYVPMAEAVLTAIADELEREHPGVRVAIHHRIGTLAVGEPAVVVAASAPHRAESFDACRAAIERLKARAPIWKKEVGASGAVWVGTGP